MEWTLLLVFLTGVGAGSALAALATRRPETVVRIGDGVIAFEGDPTQEQVLAFRKMWDQALTMDPDMVLDGAAQSQR